MKMLQRVSNAYETYLDAIKRGEKMEDALKQHDEVDNAAIRSVLLRMRESGFMVLLPMLHGTATLDAEAEFARTMRDKHVPAKYWDIAGKQSEAGLWYGMVSYLAVNPARDVVDTFRIIVQSHPASTWMPSTDKRNFWTRLYQYQLSKVTDDDQLHQP